MMLIFYNEYQSKEFWGSDLHPLQNIYYYSVWFLFFLLYSYKKRCTIFFIAYQEILDRKISISNKAPEIKYKQKHLSPFTIYCWVTSSIFILKPSCRILKHSLLIYSYFYNANKTRNRYISLNSDLPQR